MRPFALALLLTALSLEALHTVFLERKDFWADDPNAFGFSIGVTTSM